MKREIKFRAQRCRDDRWVFGSIFFVQDVPFMGETIEVIGTQFTIQWVKVKPETIGQFTGLLDKNGKEIYEGDIARFDNTIMECLWLDGECRFTLHQRPWNEFHDVSSECEIIGNIYDNPELLK